MGVEEELALLSGGLTALHEHYCSSSWRVAGLRDLCRQRGVPRSGSKAELAGRLVESVRREVEPPPAGAPD